jgi:hypothetical protein
MVLGPRFPNTLQRLVDLYVPPVPPGTLLDLVIGVVRGLGWAGWLAFRPLG